MKITCSTCGTPYEVDDSRVPPGGLTMKCTQCHTPIHVGQPDSGGGADDGWELPAPVAAPSSPSRYYLRRRTGKVFGPFLVQAIASMLEQGKLEGDELVASDGETWVSMSSVPELRQYTRGDDDMADLPVFKRDVPDFPTIQPLSPATADDDDDDLADLPAPKGAVVPPPPPVMGGFDLGDFDQIPLGTSGGDDAELPAPKPSVAPRVPPPPGFSPPGFSAIGGGDIADLPTPKVDVAELPALKVGLEYGQLDLGGDDAPELPALQDGVSDLPAPKGPLVPPPPGFEPKGGIADLPAPKQGIVDLPAPKQGVVDLLAPKQGIAELPVPKPGGTDLPGRKEGFDYGQLDLGDTPLTDLPAPAGKSELELDSDFDLPAPREDAYPSGDMDAPDLVQPKPTGPDEDATDLLAPKRSAATTFEAPPPRRGDALRDVSLPDVPFSGPEDEVIKRPSLLKRKLMMGGIGVGAFILVVGLALGLLTPFGFFGARLLTGAYSDTRQGQQLITSGRKAMSQDTFKSYDQAAEDFAKAAKKLPDDMTPVALRLQTLSSNLVRFGNDLSKRSQASDLTKPLAAMKQPTAESEAAMGLFALSRGQVQPALAQLATASGNEPGDAQVAVFLGWVQLAADKPKEARATFTRALSADSAHAGALFGLARVEHRLNANTSAAATVDKALKASPQHTGALLLKARLLLAVDKKDEAEKTLKRAMAARAESSRREISLVHAQLGDLARAQGQANEARAQYRKALKIDPQSMESQLGLAHLFFSARKLTEALAHFQSALALNPKNLLAAMGVARCFILLDEPLKAQKVLQQLRTHHPKAAEIPFLLGRVEESVKNLDAAVTYFKAAIKQRPAYFAPYGNLSQVYVKQNKPTEALALLEEANKQLPGSPLVRDAEGLVLLATKKLKGARGKFEEALRLDPGFNDARFHLGSALMQLDQLDQAKEAFLAVFKQDEAFPGLAAKLGQLYVRQENYKEAALSYDRALEVDNPPLETRLDAAQAYILAGQYEKALDQTREVLQANPVLSKARALRAEARLGQGKLDEALIEIRQAVDRDRQVEYLIILGRVHATRREYADAIDAYRDTLKLDPARLDIRFERAKLMVNGGAVRDGLKELKKVLKSRPRLAEAYLYVGLAQNALNKERLAMAAYRAAVAHDPKLGHAHFLLGQILQDTHKPGALAALHKAVDNAKETDSWRDEAYYLLGVAAQDAGQKKLAIESLLKYLRIAPRGSALRRDALKRLRKLGVRFKKPEDD